MEFKDSWNNRVLIVDDQEEIHQDFEEMLKPGLTETSTDDFAGAFAAEIDESFLPAFELLHATSGDEAYEMVKAAIEAKQPIAVAHIDVRMSPGIDGIETTRRIREIDKNIEIAIMTAYTDKPLAEIVRDMELLHKLLYIRKPFAREEIQQMTLSLAEKWNVEQELAAKRRQLTVSNRRLKAVLDSTGDAIAMFDVTGHLVFANRWYEEFFGLTEAQLKQMSPDALRRHIKRYFQEPDHFEVTESSFFANPEKVFKEIMEVRLPKRKMLYRFTAPVADAEGNAIGRIIVYRDVSKEIEIRQVKAEVSRLRAELERKYAFDNIIGRSQKMQEVYALMQQAIESNITVLIQGESGTGKELVAKAIHFNSSRKKGPFVAVNCAAIPETLIESELFGHERGAFTGATMQRIGKFESANGGTIFLDEIADMHPFLQAKLLRVLQEREIQRVGGTATLPIDVRVIAATNKDLEAALKVGKFREDLFYRIAAFPIVVPPLRERREDIPLLAEHLLKTHVDSIGRSIGGISTEALQLLINYDWPGNVRELENAIERAMLLETSEVLQARNLPTQIRSVHQSLHVLPSQSQDATPGAPAATEILPLEEVEKQTLVHALEVTDNNITKAAEALGINRVTIHRKLKKYNLLENR
ncbi:MAG: sigma 54-interacting transcriptional regulator [Candidatus Poribacteria bacterium]|nr:sigma 54-interacting transcriptional regulator [Candidatus Poribacteria bacterium]